MDGSGQRIFGLECEMLLGLWRKPSRYTEVEKRPKPNM